MHRSHVRMCTTAEVSRSQRVNALPPHWKADLYCIRRRGGPIAARTKVVTRPVDGCATIDLRGMARCAAPRGVAAPAGTPRNTEADKCTYTRNAA